MAKFQLVMRSGSASGAVFPLTEDEITFGRDAGNTIPLPDGGVSRRHARLTLQGNAYVLEDLGSTNGTLVDGQPITAPRRLRSGEVFFLGDLASFSFEVTASEPGSTVVQSRRGLKAAVRAAQEAAATPVSVPATSISTFEITLQRQVEGEWPVVIRHQPGRGALALWSRGKLRLNLSDLEFNAADEKEYARILGEALFHDEIRDAFVRAVAEAKSEHDTLRVLLFVEAEDLYNLHWERLAALFDRGWDYLLLNPGTPFSLYLPSQIERRFPPIGRRDLRALVLVAGPEEFGGEYKLASFDVSATVASVRAALGEIACDVLASTSEAVGKPTLQNLVERLTAERYTLLHIVCHGAYKKDTGDTILYFPKEEGGGPVTASTLIEWLGRLDRLPHFTFLSTCESAVPRAETGLGGLAQRLVRELGMPAVLAMTDRISIQTAEALASAFYTRLREHGEVDLALAEGLATLQGRFDVMVPALFSRLGGRPIFSDVLERPLTGAEIKFGLEQLAVLVAERAPVLAPELEARAKVLQSTLGADPGALSPESRGERQAALDALNTLSGEVIDLSYNALALGKSPPDYDARCPFRGLAAFRPEDREFFFGREALVGRLVERLKEGSTSAPPGGGNFLAVLGPSGSGKSSLVLAGLVPALGAQMAYMTPGSNPIVSLGAVLKNENQLVVVDQFEELFTLCTDEEKRQSFIKMLLNLSAKQRVVITMRADFWGECAQYKSLKEAMQANQELVGPMDAEELRGAMDLQAARVGLRFEADVSQNILDDVRGEPGAMPLLQHALLLLWNRRHGRWLRADEYRNIGGVQKAISGTADQVYDSLDPDDQQRMREIFVRLTQVSESRSEGALRDTRRRVGMKELVPANGQDGAAILLLVKRLADERLIVTSQDLASDEDQVEVAHEALIRHWPRLRGWLDEDRQSLRLREGVREAALEWDRSGRKDPSLLVHRGSRLEEAVLLSRAPRSGLNEMEQAYVDACVRLRDEERLAKERQRRIITVGAIVVAVIMFVMGVAGLGLARVNKLNERRAQAGEEAAALQAEAAVKAQIQAQEASDRADAQARIAQVQALSALALANLQNRPDHYSLLGIEAFRQLDNLQSRGALLTALEASRGIRQRLYGHTDDVNTVSFSSDGQLMASGSDDGSVAIWNTSDPDAPTQVGTVPPLDPENPAWVSTIEFQPEESLLAVGYGGSNQVTLWDLSDPGNPQMIADPLARENAFTVSSMAFSRSGILAAAFDDYESDHSIGLWDLSGAGGPELLGSMAMGNYVDSLAFSPDGSLLAAGSDDLLIDLWNVSDPANPEKVGTTPSSYNNTPYGLAFTADGGTLAAGYDNGQIVLWDVTSPENPSRIPGSLESTLDDANMVFSLAVTDAGILAAGYKDGLVSLWDISDVEDAEPLGQALKAHANAVFDVAFSPDGKTLASASRDRSVILWDVGAARSIGHPLEGHDKLVYSVAFSPDGATAATGSADGSVILWDVPSQAPIGAPLEGTSDVVGVAFSPTGHTLASAGCAEFNEDGSCTQGEIILWDSVSGQRLGQLRGHTDWVENIAFSPDGKTLASGGDDDAVILWDVATRQPIGEPLSGHADWVRSVAFSPDGKTLASGSDDATVRLWDVATRQPIGEPLTGHTKWVFSVAFSPDGKTLASAGADGLINLWDVAARERIGDALPARASVIYSLAFSPDGKTLASANNDFTVTLWDLASRQMVGQPLIGHDGSPHSVAFSPDGKHLLSGGDKGSVILWDLDTQDWISALCQRIGRNFRPGEWAQYFPDEAYRLTCPQWPAGTALSTDVLPIPEEDGSGGVLPTPTTAPQATQVPADATEAPAVEPPPAADVDALIQSARILVYENTTTEAAWAEAALNEAGYSPVYVHDSLGRFEEELTSGESWDLIIVAAESHAAAAGGFWSSLKEHADQGAAVIVETWAIDLQGEGQITPLLEACGAEFQANLEKPLPLAWYQPESEFFTSPNQVEPLAETNRYWTFQAGDLMRAGGTGDAVLLAGTNPDAADSAVILNCYGGRMILQTFSNHDYPREQITPLWQNYVYNTLKHHFAP